MLKFNTILIGIITGFFFLISFLSLKYLLWLSLIFGFIGGFTITLIYSWWKIPEDIDKETLQKKLENSTKNYYKNRRKKELGLIEVQKKIKLEDRKRKKNKVRKRRDIFGFLSKKKN